MVQVPPIAVIGVSCRMPGGDGIAEYWKLISSGSSAIRELPADRLDKSLYFDTEQGKPGRCYTDLGGVVTERPVNRQICPISDKDLQTSDSAHLTLCEVASSALKHAGMDPTKVPYRRTGVYVGHSGGSCLGEMLLLPDMRGLQERFSASKRNSKAAHHPPGPRFLAVWSINCDPSFPMKNRSSRLILQRQMPPC